MGKSAADIKAIAKRKRFYRDARIESRRPGRLKQEAVQEQLNLLSPKARRILGMITRAPVVLQEEILAALQPTSDLSAAMFAPLQEADLSIEQKEILGLVKKAG